MRCDFGLFLALSLVAFATAAPEYAGARLVVRQSTGPVPPGVSNVDCLDYSTTANMSVISANSSYRTAFIQKAPVGTIITARMLNAAQARLPALTKNATLNRQCGNLTTIAIAEAAANYTLGVVAQFTTAGLPVGIKSGPEVVLVVGFIASMLSCVWIFSG